MNLTEAIPVLIACELACRMAHRAVGIAPFGQPAIDVIFIGVDDRTLGDRPSDQRADRRLLDILQHSDNNLTGALDHAEDRRLLLGQRPAAPLPLQPTAASLASFFFTASGCPLCPATTETSSHSTSPLSATSGFRSTMPSRS